MTHWLAVVLQTPAHSAVAGPLTYQSELPLAAGTLVRVPFGTREVLGVVWDTLAAADLDRAEGGIRAVGAVLDGVAPLPVAWRQLVQFAAGYYQRSLGEVALAALPPQLRDLSAAQLARRLKRAPAATRAEPVNYPDLIALSEEQARAIGQIDTHPGPFLLFGATGSGKTEVYLRCVQALLDADGAAQALVMVPEINLTPQLEARFRARFAGRHGEAAVVSLHSGMTNPQRLKSWLAAHSGAARVVLGTRMAVFASMPRLRLIVVDEEHDPSYKQQE
ncbi:MAG TPA: DEAD/DEAH box helicase, partial [Rhodoferax sp.]|nr:DEAD/DEAH box helicase [Rhodoferax sp.]